MNTKCLFKLSLLQSKIWLFQWRSEEGYDFYDSSYQKWLQQKHPEAATSYNSENSWSILNLFPEAPIVNPVEIFSANLHFFSTNLCAFALTIFFASSAFTSAAFLAFSAFSADFLFSLQPFSASLLLHSCFLFSFLFSLLFCIPFSLLLHLFLPNNVQTFSTCQYSNCSDGMCTWFWFCDHRCIKIFTQCCWIS